MFCHVPMWISISLNYSKQTRKWLIYESQKIKITSGSKHVHLYSQRHILKYIGMQYLFLSSQWIFLCLSTGLQSLQDWQREDLPAVGPSDSQRRGRHLHDSTGGSGALQTPLPHNELLRCWADSGLHCLTFFSRELDLTVCNLVPHSSLLWRFLFTTVHLALSCCNTFFKCI